MISSKSILLLAFFASDFSTALEYGFAIRVTLDPDAPGCNPINNGAEKQLDKVIDDALDKAEAEGVIGSTFLPSSGSEYWHKFYAHDGKVEELEITDPAQRQLAYLAEDERMLQSCTDFCSYVCAHTGFLSPIYCPCCPPGCCWDRRPIRHLRVETNAEVQPAADRVEGLILEALYADKKKLHCVKQEPYEVDVVLSKKMQSPV